jgi:AcrR family transcriptional regulator
MNLPLNKEERARLRRDQIITAARICFRNHGFHGAGMAEIAQMSALSVGQIYRYFTNKDAIIEEIVRRIVETKVNHMQFKKGDVQETATMLSHRLLAGDPQEREIDHALMLEVAAEATRNPTVARILREADDRLFGQAMDMLTGLRPDLNQEQLAVWVEFMAVMCEGTAFRRLNHQKANPSLLNTFYLSLFTTILPASEKK